jgi:diguanylate cyclase (GGDEF)-like protein/PAS domain S-box-containing protein
MPVTVLLVEGSQSTAHALCTVLEDPLLGWNVVAVRAIEQARRCLEQHPVDAVIVAMNLPDGSAYDLFPALQDRPAVVLIPEGAEEQAALAMRHGFADFVVQDADDRYLLALSAQIREVLAQARGNRLRKSAEMRFARQHQLLQAIARAQALFIASAPPRAAFEALLHQMLELTGSAFGVVGQVEYGPEGLPCLRVHAITDISWDDVSRQKYAQVADQGMVFDRPHSLIGAALVSAKPLISNDPAHDARAGGLPPGHPPLQSFMGLPIHAGGEMVAMVGVANRIGGYDDEDVEFLQPLLNPIGQLEMARRAEIARRSVEVKLAQTSRLLEEKTRALELTLDSVSQGIAYVDEEGRVRIHNERFLELLDLPHDLLSRQPAMEEVLHLQRERGDFGERFVAFDPVGSGYLQSDNRARAMMSRSPEVYVRRTASGRYLEVRSRLLPGGGLVRTYTDVTDYLATQEALRQSEARWRSLTQLSSDWYWEQDADLRFVRLEGSAQQSLGMLHEEHYGLRRWELPDAWASDAQWRQHRAQLEAHAPFHDFEMQRKAPDGSLVWVSISGEPIFDSDGGFSGYRGVARNITQQKHAESEIQRLAFFDELTRLPNRRLLLERMERAAAVCERSSEHGALLFLDLDNFKQINDTLGHEWGDELLRQAAQRLEGCVRATDTVARLGGDEFVVVLQGLNCVQHIAANEAETVAQKILIRLHQPYVLVGNEVHCTSSIGIALFHDARTPMLELLQRADMAMYQAKAKGRNALCFYAPAMQAIAAARSSLEADLRQGLQRGEFLLHYQPVVDAGGQVLGAEALVRWTHPQRGMVLPGDFIGLAESTGLIIALGQRVLELACEQLVCWSDNVVRKNWTLSVNVSAREFRHPGYVSQVLDTLRQTGADPGLLRLELTESLLLQDVEDSIAKMQVLRNQGVGFSLDDFGTGYSSLSYLKRLPLDQLKIDQGFVRDVLTDPNDAAIACTVIALAHSLGLEVVAEGVETQGQRKFLLRNGCQRFQGYLFGRPVPSQELE